MLHQLSYKASRSSALESPFRPEIVSNDNDQIHSSQLILLLEECEKLMGINFTRKLQLLKSNVVVLFLIP